MADYSQTLIPLQTVSKPRRGIPRIRCSLLHFTNVVNSRSEVRPLCGPNMTYVRPPYLFGFDLYRHVEWNKQDEGGAVRLFSFPAMKTWPTTVGKRPHCMPSHTTRREQVGIRWLYHGSLSCPASAHRLNVVIVTAHDAMCADVLAYLP